MDYLAYADRPMSLTEISTELALGKSKTHRLLQTLIQANYAFQGDGSKYIASIKLWKLGSAMLRHATLRSMAEAEMQSLMEQTGESVHLSVLERSEEHTSELQSLMRISYAVLCLKKKKNTNN